MRFVIQRVTEAKVTVDDKLIGQIGKGLMILIGLTGDDKDEYIDHVTDKFLNLRLWDDDKGVRWKESVKSQGLELLLVSQFTLYSHMKGNKPDFHLAMDNEPARVMFDKIVERVKSKYDKDKVKTGAFGEHMMVSLVNDGPVTIEWEYPGDKLENVANNTKNGGVKIDKSLKKELTPEEKEKKEKEKKERREKKKQEKKEENAKKEEDKKEAKEESKKEEPKKEETKKEESKNEKEEEIDTTKK